jgi:hypothetical protein
MEISKSSTQRSLLFIRRYAKNHFGSLSTGLLQEIALYISPPLLLPALFKSSVRLFDLESGLMTAFPSRISFSVSSRYCFISPTEVFCLVDSSSNVCRISTVTKGIEVLPALPGKRIAPGMICLFPWVYLFGGVFIAEYTGEKMNIRTEKWTILPKMQMPTGSLFPCALKEIVYFSLFAADSPCFQSFNTLTEIYQCYPISLPSRLRPLLSYVKYGRIWTIAGRRVVSWSPEDRNIWVEECKSGDLLPWKPNMTPICVGKWVYWTTFAGDLMKFDRERQEICTKDTSKSRQKRNFQALCEISNI